MDRLLSGGWLAWVIAFALLGLSALLWLLPRRRVARIVARGLALVLALPVGAVIVGTADYVLQRAGDAKRFPPPGQMINVAGRRLHLHCIGERAGPLSVVVGGLAGPSIMYEGVLRRLAATARACVYDRAGQAWSDSGPFPRTLERQIEDLRALLRSAGEKPPYVLIAHSYGGLIARAYAARYRDDLAGIILADTSVESEIFWQGATGEVQRGISRSRWFAALLPVGLGQVLRRTSDPIGQMFGGAFLAERDAIYASYSPAALATEASEWAQFVPAASGLYLNRLADLPIAIISGDQPLAALDRSDPENLGEHIAQALSEEGQDRLTTLSTRALRVRTDSDHLVPQRRPETILSALQWIKSGAPTPWREVN